MTDPKVIEALEALNNFCRCLFNNHGALSASIVVREKIDALLAAAAPVPAPAPVAPSLPWVVRRRSDGMVLAQCALVSDATTVQYAYNDGYAEVGEVAPAAPAIVPVLFNGTGRAMLADGQRASQQGPEGWSAEVSDDGKWLAVYVGLRPGEDAGELTARMLAAGGRSA